jgi:TP53 regulating kinase and related kinases
MKCELIQRGAEAILVKCGEEVSKKRVVKGYRIKEMDEKIRKGRTRQEGRLMEKAGKLIMVPKVLKVDEKKKEIDMEFIDGKKLSESLDDLKEWKEVCLEIGRNIAKLHDADIIHGDLTTSNMIWVEGSSPQLSTVVGTNEIKLDSKSPIDKTRSARLVSRKTTADSNSGRLYFIDFGLGFGNGRIEDKAVDLHLIKQALEAKHYEKWEKYFESVLKGYKESENYGEVMKRFEKVEKRGRYKQNY